MYYLYTYGQIILFDALVVQGMVNLDVRPSEPVVRTLLQIECVELVRLCSGARHQPVEHCRITLDPRAKQLHQCYTYNVPLGPATGFN